MSIVSGVSLIVVCLCIYFLAFHFKNKNSCNNAILLLMIAGLILRVYVSLDIELHQWDERYHALVAKNLLRHFFKPTLYENPILPYDYTNWTANHVWLHKQPLPLWLMSISIYLFGNNALAVRLPSILMSTLSIYLLFFIAQKLFNKKIGFLSAFLFSINGLIIELTGGRVATDHIDISFMFFVLLSVFCIAYWSNRKSAIYSFLIGLIIGISMLCKWLPGLFVIPIWFIIRLDYYLDQNKLILIKELMYLLAGSIIVFLPWQIYTYNQFPNEMKWETFYNISHFSNSVENHSGSVFYFIDKIRINYGELVYLPLIWFIIQLFKKFELKNLALLSWFLLPLIFFSLAQTKMQGYLLFASIPIFIFTSEFYYWIRSIDSQKWKWLFSLIAILLIVLPIRYCIERVKPFEDSDVRTKWVYDLKQLETQNAVLFNYKRPIEAMFYTDLISAYDFIPSKEIIDSLKNKGIRIFINKEELSENFIEDNYLSLIKLR